MQSRAAQTPSSNDSPGLSGDTNSTSKAKVTHSVTKSTSHTEPFRAPSAAPEQSLESDDDDLLRQQSLVAPLATPSSQVPGQQPSYYGRTSALFDEESTDNKALWVKRQAVDNTRRQLLGEAAYQSMFNLDVVTENIAKHDRTT